MINLPLYNATISSEEDGLLVMSLVDCPATETNWLYFSEDEKPLTFSIQNEEHHILLGVVMLADTPIYRRDSDGYEYYIQYSKETLEMMSQKMLRDNTFNNIDLNHNGEILEKGIVELRELFIKDSDKGINPKGLESVPDGSLLCSYKVNNEELWKQCKDGHFNGFSLEGYFTPKKVEMSKVNEEDEQEREIFELIEKLKNKINK